MTTIAITHQPVDGVDVRAATSDGHHDETLLLTSPWPESLYAFESTWSALSEQANLVAVDLPGFGGSERRDELLTPRTMGAFLVRLMDQWELGSPHLFGPDVGTSAALFAAGQAPGRVRSVTNAEYLCQRLPDSDLHEFDAGHFLWEDAGDEFAAVASAWVGGGYREAG